MTAKQVPSQPRANSADEMGDSFVLAVFLIAFLVVALFCLTGFIARLWS